MKRIKWGNVFKTILFIAALYVVIHDIYWLFISPIFTSELLSWTYVGFLTFGFSLYYMISFVEDFKKEVK